MSEQLPEVDESEVIQGCFTLTIRLPGKDKDLSNFGSVKTAYGSTTIARVTARRFATSHPLPLS